MNSFPLVPRLPNQVFHLPNQFPGIPCPSSGVSIISLSCSLYLCSMYLIICNFEPHNVYINGINQYCIHIAIVWGYFCYIDTPQKWSEHGLQDKSGRTDIRAGILVQGGGRGRSELDTGQLLTQNKLAIIYIYFSMLKMSRQKWFFLPDADDLGYSVGQGIIIYPGFLRRLYQMYNT